VPNSLIDWTGERCVPWADDIPVIYEHYHRYLFATVLVAGKRVLDLGSGEGYGAALLAANAASVLGIDIDEQAVLHSQLRYPLQNLQFRCGDILDLSAFPDASFDAVVCFEAIEHVDDHQRVLTAVTRVLVPGGLFVVSTPDRRIYSEEHGNDNPFHVHELSRDEFETLLTTHFAHHRMWAEGTITGSVISALQPGARTGEIITLAKRNGDWVPGTPLVAPYLVAIASDASLPPASDYSTLADLGVELVRTVEQQLAMTRAELEQQVATTRAELEQQAALELANVMEELEVQSRTYNETARSLEQAHERAARTDEELQRLTEALRVAKRDAAAASILSQELDEIRHSKLFRAARSYWGTLDRVIPPGSSGRRYYNRLLRTALPPASKVPVRAPVTGTGTPVPPLPAPADPEASIIIPVHNNWELTAGCLRSIVDASASVPYDVIVVDDASQPDTATFLRQVEGITLITLQHNSGFVHAVNAGIAAARGEFIVLLNNDTVVTPGWLDALVDRAKSDRRVGVVGAKLVYPDGRLQEAGGIVWRDGSAWNYGRYNDPDDPAYTFARDVDYCSGACLLVRADILNTLGGLDTRYVPAYYEDADLAFATRELGFRVVYEPKAVVCHIEGATSGRDIRTGAKRYQEVNQEDFRIKWQSQLATQHPHDPALARLANWRTLAGRALVIDEHVPTPNRDAGSRRMFELLRLLSNLGFGVTFVPHNGAEMPPYSNELRELGVEVLSGGGDLASLLEQLAPALQVAILSRPGVAWPHLPVIRKVSPATKVIYDTVDLHFLREQRRASLDGDPVAARDSTLYHGMELALARAADATFVVSSTEKALLLAENPALQVYVIPTIHRDEQRGRPFEGREGLLFVGSFQHPPNVDGVRWLAEEILPLVRDRLPGVCTSIAGSYPTDDIRALSRTDVRVLGWVPDLEDAYARARVFLAPLRYGAGVKGKIGESLAHGLPVVTTTVGAEGMGLVHRHDVLIADTAEEFAAAVAECYSHKDLWARLSVNGRRAVSHGFSPAAVESVLRDVLTDLGVPMPPADSTANATFQGNRP